jgi:hypothetical protein
MAKQNQPFPEPPAHLSARSQDIWRTIGPEKAMNPCRRLILQSGLEALDLADKAREAIAEQGLTTTTKTTGAVHVNPAGEGRADGAAAGPAFPGLDRIRRIRGMVMQYDIESRLAEAIERLTKVIGVCVRTRCPDPRIVELGFSVVANLRRLADADVAYDEDIIKATIECDRLGAMALSAIKGALTA